MTYLTFLEGVAGARLDPGRPQRAAPREPLRARYELDRVREHVPRESIARGPASLWRYAPLLPVAREENVVTLGEGWTPLVRASRLARSLGMHALFVKDEGRNPSGTFKDRGAAVAVSRYVELGVETVGNISSGNAGGSWSLYAARAGITCVNLLPADAQSANLELCRASAQPTFVIENWHDAGRVMAEACEAHGWLNVSTLREPYRLEGKKTLGLEIAEQLGWRMPEVIFYPVGGGLGAIAIWKAFDELLELGWITGRRPRLHVTQYAGCAPIVKAWDEGRDECTPWGVIDTPPGGLKSPDPPGGRAVLALMRECGGGAIAVTTQEAHAAADELASAEGIFACPESATTLAGLRKARARGLISPDETVVIVSTGSGLKSTAMRRPSFPVIAKGAELHA